MFDLDQRIIYEQNSVLLVDHFPYRRQGESVIAMMVFKAMLKTGLLFLIVWCGFVSSLWAETNGVTENEILIGQSCALSGPNLLLGTGMRDGALLYFNEINSKGGIHGKKIKLISYDDGYEPDRCLANTKTLIDLNKVFLLFGYVGTPTAKVAAPVAIEKDVPFFGPFTGANLLREPFKKQIFNIRASYFQETEMMVERLTSELNFHKISVFYQNDAYGEDGLEGVRRALEKRNMTIFSKAHYERNTTDVNDAVSAFKLTAPEAVIMIGAYAACAQLVQTMREKKCEIVFLNVSFVGADALGSVLANRGIGVVVTQVTPFPYYAKIPIVAEYKTLLKSMMPDSKPSYVSLEGYIAAKTLCKILMASPKELTRSTFIETAEKQNNLDLGGFVVSFGPNHHTGSSMVSLSQIGPGGYPERIESLRNLREY